MKVVLFCGGLGTRLREDSDAIPKPLVHVGSRPILWHLMKYYAHYGHDHFILCLGYKGQLIREFFLNYDPRYTDDFLLMNGKSNVELSGSDVPDWKIQFVDTGLHSNIAERLQAVRPYVEREEVFLANYSDQLSDLPLSDYLVEFGRKGAVAGFVAVKSSNSFHEAKIEEGGTVVAMQSVADSELWINGGYIVLRQEIFDYIRSGEELVDQPFNRLIAARRLYAYKHTGFWKAMDTFKDKILYDRMSGRGDTPWEIWQKGRRPSQPAAAIERSLIRPESVASR